MRAVGSDAMATGPTKTRSTGSIPSSTPKWIGGRTSSGRGSGGPGRPVRSEPRLAHQVIAAGCVLAALARPHPRGGNEAPEGEGAGGPRTPRAPPVDERDLRMFPGRGNGDGSGQAGRFGPRDPETLGGR